MYNVKKWIISILFVAIDSGVILSSFVFAFWFRDKLSQWLELLPSTWNTIQIVAQLAIFFIVGIFFLQGLYPGYGLTAVKEMEKMGKSVTAGFALLAVISYFTKSFHIFPRSIFPIAWFIVFFALPLTRFVERNLLSRSSWYGIPVVVFGDGDWARDVILSLKRMRRLGWFPVTSCPELGFDPRKPYGKASLAILAFTSSRTLGDMPHLLNQRFRRMILLREADKFGSLWVETRDLDGFLGLEFQYHLLSQSNVWFKRLVDIICSIILLVILSPVFIFIALLVVIDSPGSVFYQQERIGKDFHLFQVLKFRTMVIGAEEKLRQLLEEDPIARMQYEEFHKLENDPRVTKLGNFLRRYSIDELPQLFNVLKGEMSLVGPRAYMSSELDDMGSYAPIILRVHPGITGWWQVFGRHQTAFRKRLQLDEYYISNWSIWMDFYILMKTVGVVLSGTGR